MSERTPFPPGFDAIVISMAAYVQQAVDEARRAAKPDEQFIQEAMRLADALAGSVEALPARYNEARAALEAHLRSKG